MSLVSMPTEKCIPIYGSGSSARTLKVNVSNLLSQMNMRLYRQSMNYKVKISLADLNSDFGNNFQIFTLPNTWLTQGAIKHAFKMYKTAMQDELKQTGGKTSKWHDFRINGADADGTDTAAQALGFDGNSWTELAAAADTSLSVITDTAGTEKGFHAVGNVSNSYNIIQEYVKHLLRFGNEAQESPDGQSYEGLIDSADDLDNLLERGDLPPYDKDFGGWAGDGSADTNTTLVFQDTLYYNRSRDTHDPDGGTTSDYDTYVPMSQRLVSKTFTAPLGLVWIFSESDLVYTSRPQFCLHVSPGKYKGVDATPIIRYNL